MELMNTVTMSLEDYDEMKQELFTLREEKALEAYPLEADGVDMYPISRNGYIAGYHQAEKELALTVEDIKDIIALSKEIRNAWYGQGFSEECLSQVVLERFNEERRKNYGKETNL